MIVADTNLIVNLFTNSEYSLQAERLFLKDPSWVAPLIWRSEFRNVLVYYIWKKIIQVEDAQQIMSEAMIMMKGREYEVASQQVLYLAATSTCSAYDCEFVALAQDLEIPFVTLDHQILEQFPRTAFSFLEK